MDFMIPLFFLLVIIPSAILHEYAHGWMANQLGDPTARLAGRLTLNPRSHIDLWGTIMIPILLFFATGGRFLFGYAKPVPYNPYNLKRLGPMWVALAGPASNILLAIVFGALVRLLPAGDLTPFLAIIVYANVLLAIFNMVPIPPLDGSKVLFALMPDSLWQVREMLERYGFVFLLIFIFFFFRAITPIIDFFFRFFAGPVVLF